MAGLPPFTSFSTSYPDQAPLSPLVGNCGYTKETAEKAIAEGHADLISFGRPFISNPDLVERFRNGWPLAEPAPMSDWSSPSAGKGYTDFPAYAPQHHG